MSDHCGCCLVVNNVRQYLPQLHLNAYATIQSSAARTTLSQTFVNPSKCILKEVSYQFPLYDGVSVVGFQCRVGNRLLHSEVKPKEQANAEYRHAVTEHQTAAIMDYSDTQGDIFLVRLGNVPAEEKITVDITFVGELKQDAHMDGIRYTLPNSIAPRYDNILGNRGPSVSFSVVSPEIRGISITVDVAMEKASIIREIHSPSHSVKVTLGHLPLTTKSPSPFDLSRASVSLKLDRDQQALLERDFVLLTKVDGMDNPRALLESHPTLPGQRALMATLVPKFHLTPINPEIIFVIDRSGSMEGKIPTLRKALSVLLKSLPVGTSFNICSFGSYSTFLWPNSRLYNASSLRKAMSLVKTIGADFGGTELQSAVEASVQSRLKNKELEVLIITDGQITDQDSLFQFIRETTADNTARFFTLGIGDMVSHSLLEGAARAGRGFYQSVLEAEELDRKLVRILKGALTPHIYDYTLEVEYEQKHEPDYEVMSNVEVSTPGSLTETVKSTETMKSTEMPASQPIVLFDESFQDLDMNLGVQGAENIHPPNVTAPKSLQAPYKIPPLYPFVRTTVYLLMDPESSDKLPQSLMLSASSKEGPLRLRIPVTNLGNGETIHQLAAHKAMIELEEGHGWLEDVVVDDAGNTLLCPNAKEKVMERECQKLGVKYQVTGKHCSFIAMEIDTATSQPTNVPHAILINSPDREDSDTELGMKKFLLAPDELSPDHDVKSMDYASSPSARSATQGPYRHSSRHPYHSESQSRGASRSQSPSLPHSHWPSRGSSADQHSRQAVHSGWSCRCSSPDQHSQQDALSDWPMATAEGESHDAFSETAAAAWQNVELSTFHALVDLQTYSGYWKWTKELFDILGCETNEIKFRVTDLLPDMVEEDGSLEPRQANVIATLLVVGFLERKYGDLTDVWQLVSDKAARWLDTAAVDIGVSGKYILPNKSEIIHLLDSDFDLDG